MDNNFYGFSRCVYGTQGELLCGRNAYFSSETANSKPAIEQFVNEPQNIKNPVTKTQQYSSTQAVIQNAITKNYCQVKSEKDPKTGVESVTIKKTCN